MSRIGLKPITVPDGVDVQINLPTISVKGPKGNLSRTFPGQITFDKNDKEILVKRPDNARENKAKHGTYRAVLFNMIEGVSKGFEKKLELVGVGFRAQAKGKDITLNLGFSHPIEFAAREDITFKIEKETSITIEGPNKEVVGQVAAEIRKIRPPEPYKGKGVRYFGEEIILKQGKTAAK